jgi:hypothetical protein
VLSVALTNLDKILIHCFKLNCSQVDVAAALGLSLDDLMPANSTQTGSCAIYKSPSEWASAAALVDAIAWTSALISNDPKKQENIVALLELTTQFQLAAKTAMRSSKQERIRT